MLNFTHLPIHTIIQSRNHPDLCQGIRKRDLGVAQSNGRFFYTNAVASSSVPTAERAIVHKSTLLAMTQIFVHLRGGRDAWVGDVSEERHRWRAMASWFWVCLISLFVKWRKRFSKKQTAESLHRFVNDKMTSKSDSCPSKSRIPGFALVSANANFIPEHLKACAHKTWTIDFNKLLDIPYRLLLWVDRDCSKWALPLFIYIITSYSLFITSAL